MNLAPTTHLRHQLQPSRLATIVALLLALCLPLAALATSIIQAASVAVAADRETDEYEVKALYLYNFLQFVHWPAGKCPSDQPGGAREISVIGDSEIEEPLRVLASELEKRGEKISLRFFGPYQHGMDLSGCRLIFISRSEKKHFAEILASIGRAPALTVCDGDDLLAEGCMVALLSRMNKVRWAVNRQPVDQAGLRLDSRLLQMAVKVIE